MSQISAHYLDEEVHDNLLVVLTEVLASTNKTKSGLLFTHHFLSIAEQIMLAKRVGIALLLKRGYSYDLAMDYLKVSRGTVAKVAEILHEQGNESQQILDRIITNKQIQEVLGRFEIGLRKLLPPKGKDWSVWRKNLAKQYKDLEKPF